MLQGFQVRLFCLRVGQREHIPLSEFIGEFDWIDAQAITWRGKKFQINLGDMPHDDLDNDFDPRKPCLVFTRVE